MMLLLLCYTLIFFFFGEMLYFDFDISFFRFEFIDRSISISKMLCQALAQILIILYPKNSNKWYQKTIQGLPKKTKDDPKN